MKEIIDAFREYKARDIYGHEIETKKICIASKDDLNRYASFAGLAVLSPYGFEKRDETRRDFIKSLAFGASLASLCRAQEEEKKPKLVLNIDRGYLEFNGDGYYIYRAKLPEKGDLKIPKMVKKFGDFSADENYKVVWRDGLRHLLDMNGVDYNKQKTGAATTYRFRQIPIPYWIENESNLPENFVRSVVEAADMWTWKGKQILKKSEYNPWEKGEDGIIVKTDMGGARSWVEDEEINRYPKKTAVAYPTPLVESRLAKGIVSHEFGHAIGYARGSPPHSRYANDMMSVSPKQRIKPVENENVFILYSWEPQTDTGGFIIVPNPDDSIVMGREEI